MDSQLDLDPNIKKPRQHSHYVPDGTHRVSFAPSGMFTANYPAVWRSWSHLMYITLQQGTENKCVIIFLYFLLSRIFFLIFFFFYFLGAVLQFCCNIKLTVGLFLWESDLSPVSRMGKSVHTYKPALCTTLPSPTPPTTHPPILLLLLPSSSSFLSAAASPALQVESIAPISCHMGWK